MKNTDKLETVLLGTAEVDITPDCPVETVGFGKPDNISRGTAHPLSAQIAVWELAGDKCALITIDSIGFSAEHSARLRNEVGRLLQITGEKVMLCFSHTHSAPNDSVEREYYHCTEISIIQGIRKAAGDMRPVLAAWDQVCADIGVNRRTKGGAIDRRIGVLKAEDAADKSTRLILLRLTAHCNVLKSDNYLISPDYFGHVRDRLQKKYGCTVMLTQGASGNIAPKYFQSELTPVDASDPERYIRSYDGLGDMAEVICTVTEPLIDTIGVHPVRYLDMYSVYKELSADVPEYARALEIAEEAGRLAGIDGIGWLKEIRRLTFEGIKTQTESLEIQYFALADGCICGVPCEIMCEFAVRASLALGDNKFFFGGYTNGCGPYFPTEEEYDKGGYEVYWAMLFYYQVYHRVAPFNRESATELIKAAVENAKLPIVS